MDLDPYGYKPTLSICILFLCLFGISSRDHSLFSSSILSVFLYTAVLAGLVEILGWSGRLWSNQNLPNSTAFTMQITCTIMGPTPLLAANFIILAGIIRKIGDCYCRLSPRLYSIIFLSCDFIALAVQGGGGGIASAAKDTDTVNLGAHIMLAGIVFQLVVIICYMVLAIEFFWRYSRGTPVLSGSGVMSKLTGSTKVAVDEQDQLMIYHLQNLDVRESKAIYRTIELTDGFHGKIIKTQWLFNVFDGAMIVLAMYAFNVAHPGRLLVEDKETAMYTSTGSVSGVGNGGSAGTLQQLPGEKIQDLQTV
ncbi:RTA1 like protein-domain-containing protein [Lentinula novae-zelandiae]|nr:RTA1 like protein-domain-containing protein [Lentinula novae-zelandiae]